MKLIKANSVYVPLRATFTKSDEPKNNKLEITLPPEVREDFSVDDEATLYDDNGNLLFRGYVVNVVLNVNAKTPRAQITFFDKESLLFNRVWSESITESTPIIIGSVLSKVANDLQGKHLSRVTVKYVGYPRTDGIQVTLTEHPEIEFTNEDIVNNTSAYQAYVNLPSTDKFEQITFAGMLKPVYDWVNDLSQPENTKTDKRFVWYLDEYDTFRWYATSSISNPTVEYLFNDYTLEIKQESSVNFIIAYCGDDLNGAPIYIWAYKDYSGTPNIQESIKDWGDIARDLKDKYIDNTALREAVKEKGLARARAFFDSLTLGKYSGQFTLFEPKYRVGDLLRIKHAYGNEEITVLIKSVSMNYDIKNGARFVYTFEEEVK